MALARELARFAADLAFERIPPEVVASVRLRALDILGIALAASTGETAPALRGALEGWTAGQGGPCTVVGTKLGAPAPLAALANGALAHGLDFDDTHAASITHASAVVLPTVLALGEASGVDGRRVVTAAVAGLEGEPAPARAPDFRPEQVRRPLVLVRLVRGAGRWEERESRALPDEYQGALLEALNARAVLAREVQVRGEREGGLEPRAALARAREVGADHAVLVEIRVSQVQPVFCRDGRRPFRAAATLWSQSLQVLRAQDGAVRLSVAAGSALDLLDVEPDCENPGESRQRSAGEVIDEAVRRMLGRVVGP